MWGWARRVRGFGLIVGEGFGREFGRGVEWGFGRGFGRELVGEESRELAGGELCVGLRNHLIPSSTCLGVRPREWR